MKRPRSHGEDLESVGEKGVCKDWGRRDQDLDRSSSHRRLYTKSENSRKAYDRSLDEEREVSRTSRKRFDHESDGFEPSRKRFDHESDGFERRKGFDRYRDFADRQIPLSSPRNLYSGERIHRSESFSSSRREIPKGFRSERDRSRREESVSAWRRFSSKDGEEDLRFGFDSGRGNRVGSEDRANRVGSEDRGITISPITRSPQGSRDVVKSPPSSKDSGSEQTKSVELKKTEESSSSEMEEGELEPERDLEQVVSVNAEDCKESEINCRVETEMNSEKEVKSLEEEKLELNKVAKDDVCDEKLDGGTLERVSDTVEEVDEVADCPECDVNELGGKEEDLEANGGGEKGKLLEEERKCLPSPDHEPEFRGKEEPIEETVAEKSSALNGEQNKDINLEAEAEGTGFPESNKEIREQNSTPEVTLKFLTDKLTENSKDKGKSLAVSLSTEENRMEDGGWMGRDTRAGRVDTMEGPSSRGFELFFRSDVAKTEKINNTGENKQKEEKLKMEPLDLSLGLPNISLSLSHDQSQQDPNSPSRGRSVHSLATTFRTNSDGFTASGSFPGSQPFIHNPSCYLTQNSFENYEHSVGSHPIFQGVDQVSHGSWPGQSSNEPKRKEVPLYQRILQNGNGVLHASQSSQGVLNGQAVQGQQYLRASEGSSGIPNGLERQSSLSRQLSGQLRYDEVRSPTHSVGSRETRSEHSKDKKRVMRERNNGSLLKSGQREMEQLALGGIGVVERFVAKIVSEPIHMMSRRIQETAEQSIAYLKESICEMIESEDKNGLLRALQEALRRRSDLALETLTSAHRVQLEILVALKTGRQDFLRQTNNIPSSDLSEIFLNLKCRNLTCRSILPVDECDCKVCSQKNGFCSACMCIVCSKFDMASNTCSWVGCDVCVHWCHTDCALRDSHIRNGRSVTGAQGTTEMQFHCVACDHPSEMFGFVKEVFKTCAKDWKAETLYKELEYVRRIFRDSDDARGKQLHDVAARMLEKLEKKSNLSEVYTCLMAFLTESDSKLVKAPSFSVKELSQKNPGEGSNGMVGPSQDAMWLRSVSMEKAPRMDNASGVLPRLDWDRVGTRTEVPDLPLNIKKKPVVDELESIVRIKQAEAKMFQVRADDARREAEGLKRIAVAKNEKIDEEYTTRIAKLRLVEVEERRRQKLEELQVLERAHREYFNMKIRMEADIKDLLLKMEATKRNLST
ncbi:fibronectin type III domain protein (DUF1423) [Tasmannia lanceolata]|uniref:fibronectin type III domain protein (DUF1423) n=1 Tax=Tasmannia lanceolata TaxID=3420 RepID=UPI0040649CE6